MKKQISGVLFLLLLSVCVSAQTTDKAVEKIRSVYTSVAEKAKLAEADPEHGQLDELFLNELVVNKLDHQWRAVGRHVLTYKFFYKVMAGDSEGHMYPDQLVMVRVIKQVSNRTYTEEYLYSDKGALIFYFQRAENDDQTPAERRVYFSGVKAIRLVEDAKTRDRLSAKDLGVVKEIAGESAKIKGVFSQSLKLY